MTALFLSLEEPPAGTRCPKCGTEMRLVGFCPKCSEAGAVLAAYLRDEAGDISRGSAYAWDQKRTCRGCGGRFRSLEDGYCAQCNEEPE